jgi:hypothetical protein
MTCNFCQKMPLPASARAGTCSSCSAKTPTTAHNLCTTCAKAQSRCNRCGRSMTANPMLQNACDTDSCACIF